MEAPTVHIIPADPVALAALRSAAGSLGFRLYELDATGIDSKAGILESLSETMRFPATFGGNWDAALDFMRDLSWDKAAGYVLVVKNLTWLLAASPGDLEHLIGIAAQAAADWAQEGIRFHLAVVGGSAMARKIMNDFTLRTARPEQYPLQQVVKMCDHSDEAFA